MKLKTFTLFVFVIICLNATNAQKFYTPKPSTPIIVKNPHYLTNVFVTNLISSDTFVIKQNTGYWYIGGCQGVDSLHPMVFINEGAISLSSGGIGIENCKYLKVLGWGTGYTSTQMGITINGGGTNGYIKGLCDYIQVSGTMNLNGSVGGWWIKLEAPDACNYSNPNDYLFPNTMNNIWFSHNQFGKSDGTGAVGGEAIYAISTGAYGRDQVPCQGNQIKKPLWGRNFHLDSNLIYNCGRSGIQLSGCYGVNTINGNKIYRVGRELNSSQGAGIRTGYGTSDSTEVAYNTVINSYIYNYDIETGANFHDNYGDSAGYYLTTQNPQGIPSTIFSAALPNSHIRICNNQMYRNTASPSTQYAIYGSNNYASSGNVVGTNNIGYVAVLSTPFNYTTNCGGAPTCPGIYDTGVNNGFNTAVQIPFNTDVKGTIANFGDDDYYKIIVTTPDTIKITLTNLPKDYSLFLFDSTHALVKSSKKAGLANEIILHYFGVTGKYFIRVQGAADSIYDPANCYTLRAITTQQQGFSMSQAIAQKTSISVYPNPAHSSLSVSMGKTSNNATITIVNSYGQPVIIKKASNAQENIDVSKLGSGVYMISIIDKNGHKIFIDKFIKQ